MPRAEIAVIGAGGWGTALAFYLAEIGHTVTLWVRRSELAAEIRETRENRGYLPGCRLPASVRVTAEPREALHGIDRIICAVPSHTVRQTFSILKPYVRSNAAILSATKGIENESCLLVSQVLDQVLEKKARLAALSGPSFALEVVRGDPTAAVVASTDEALASSFQTEFSGRNLRLYTNSDLIGTQIGGAVKNIIAIASGVVAGLGFGHNTSAALITRGLAELKRLCVASGGLPETLSGLAGLGDLVLTCTGALSRNRSVGVELGKGRKLQDVLEGTRSVAEGVRTTRSAYTLARRLKIEMPITEQMYQVLYEDKSPLEAIRDLMERQLRSES